MLFLWESPKYTHNRSTRVNIQKLFQNDYGFIFFLHTWEAPVDMGLLALLREHFSLCDSNPSEVNMVAMGDITIVGTSRTGL